MTIYGGKVKGKGVHLDADGFFIVCCKCGWHSEVEIEKDKFSYDGEPIVKLICNKCGNEVEV